MRSLFLASAVVFLIGHPAAAQDVTVHLWFDLFTGPDGTVVYPQYQLKLETKNVVLTGYGFWERAPGEPDFTNHVNSFTWKGLSQVSLWTEVGGRTREWNVPEPAGGPIPAAAFFQIGPRVNLDRLFGLPVDHLFVAYLPHLVGIRPNNWLLAAGLRPIPLGKVKLSVDGYRRFFRAEKAGLEAPDYAEYWFLVQPVFTQHLGVGAFLLHDGKSKHLFLGVRLLP